MIRSDLVAPLVRRRLKYIRDECEQCASAPPSSWCANCQSRANLWKAALDAGVPAEKVVIIENGIDRSFESTAAEFDHQTEKHSSPRDLYSLLREYLESCPRVVQDGQSMFWWGTNDTGKTVAACWLLMKIRAMGFSPQYVTFPDIHDWEGEQYENPVMRQLLKEIWGTDFLIIDEIGKERKVSRTVQLLLETKVKGRWENLLPTLLITNKDLNYIKQTYGPSFWSILHGWRIFLVHAEEKFRLKARAAW